ncbi:hypothetical protein NL676_015909 [Syzygium grande]|nr:hypothetical protein NL676_015909 [Syzygium grande]
MAGQPTSPRQHFTPSARRAAGRPMPLPLGHPPRPPSAFPPSVPHLPLQGKAPSCSSPKLAQPRLPASPFV